MTEEQLRSLAAQLQGIGLADATTLFAAAQRCGLRWSDLGVQHAVAAPDGLLVFWQTPHGDLLTDGEGEWGVSDSYGTVAINGEEQVEK